MLMSILENGHFTSPTPYGSFIQQNQIKSNLDSHLAMAFPNSHLQIEAVEKLTRIIQWREFWVTTDLYSITESYFIEVIVCDTRRWHQSHVRSRQQTCFSFFVPPIIMKWLHTLSHYEVQFCTSRCAILHSKVCKSNTHGVYVMLTCVI